MQARINQGYPLPDNIAAIEGHRCLLVFIPDDDQCLANFHGAYHELGKWLLHEKDGTTAARDIARKWEESYWLTMEHGWQRDIIMALCNEDWQSLIDVLTNIQVDIQFGNQQLINTLTVTNQTINNQTNQQVNNAIFQMCLDCGMITPVEPPELPEVDTQSPPVGNDETEYLEYLCRASAWAIDEYVIGKANQLLTTSGIISSLTAISLGIILATGGIGAPLAAILAILAALLLIVSQDKIQLVKSEIQAARTALICALYNSRSPSAAITAVNAAISDLDGNTQDMIGNLLHTDVLNNVYYNSSWSIPETYDSGFDCEDNCYMGGVLPIRVSSSGILQSVGWYKAFEGALSGVPLPDHWLFRPDGTCVDSSAPSGVFSRMNSGQFTTHGSIGSWNSSDSINGHVTAGGTKLRLVVSQGQFPAGNWQFKVWQAGSLLASQSFGSVLDGLTELEMAYEFTPGADYHISFRSSSATTVWAVGRGRWV